MKLDGSFVGILCSAHTLSGVCNGCNYRISKIAPAHVRLYVHISTAPAVAPARIERIALGFHWLVAVHHFYTNLLLTFFFSVVAVAIVEILHLKCEGVFVLEACAQVYGCCSDSYL